MIHKYNRTNIYKFFKGGRQPKKFVNSFKNVINNYSLDDMRPDWFYNNILHNLVNSIKYNDHNNFGFDLGALLDEEFLEEEIGAINMVISILTLEWLKKRERSYNQAFWLAKGLTYIYTASFDTSIIKPRRHIISQTMLGSTERMINFDSAFSSNKFLDNEHIFF